MNDKGKIKHIRSIPRPVTMKTQKQIAEEIINKRERIVKAYTDKWDAYFRDRKQNKD